MTARTRAAMKLAAMPDEKAYPAFFAQQGERSRFRIIVDLAYAMNPRLPRTRVRWTNFQTLSSIAGWILILLQEKPTLDHLSETCPGSNAVLRNFEGSLRRLAPGVGDDVISTLCVLFRMLNFAIAYLLDEKHPMSEAAMEAALQDFQDQFAWKLRPVLRATLKKYRVPNSEQVLVKYTRSQLARTLDIAGTDLKTTSTSGKKKKKNFWRGPKQGGKKKKK